LIKFQDDANTSRTHEQSPIPVLTGPGVGDNFVDVRNAVTAKPSRQGYLRQYRLSQPCENI